MRKCLANSIILALGTLLFRTGYAYASSDPILVGLIAGTTGAYGSTGVATVQGAQLAVDKINASGGVLGRPLKLEWHNDDASATLAGQLFKKLVSNGAVAIAGLAGYRAGDGSAGQSIPNSRYRGRR